MVGLEQPIFFGDDMSITFLFKASVRGLRQFPPRHSKFLLAVLLVIPATASAQVRETPNRWIRGVAKVTLDRDGKSQISFNPRRCRELGPDLCEFFRTHEYGHVNLRHLERGVATPQAEAEADLWAAKNASPNAVRAAKEFFLSGKGGSRVHGTPQQRARRMDVGRSAQTNSTSVDSATRTSITQVKQRGTKKTPRKQPKSYSATWKKRVRHHVQTPPTALKTAGHITRSPSKASQPNRRTYSGYVPRGDFLNPR